MNKTELIEAVSKLGACAGPSDVAAACGRTCRAETGGIGSKDTLARGASGCSRADGG